jgi:hypothetical protein
MLVSISHCRSHATAYALALGAESASASSGDEEAMGDDE